MRYHKKLIPECELSNYLAEYLLERVVITSDNDFLRFFFKAGFELTTFQLTTPSPLSVMQVIVRDHRGRDRMVDLQSVLITIKVVSSNPVHGEVYSILHYVIKSLPVASESTVVFAGYFGFIHQ